MNTIRFWQTPVVEASTLNGMDNILPGVMLKVETEKDPVFLLRFLVGKSIHDEKLNEEESFVFFDQFLKFEELLSKNLEYRIKHHIFYNFIKNDILSLFKKFDRNLTKIEIDFENNFVFHKFVSKSWFFRTRGAQRGKKIFLLKQLRTKRHKKLAKAFIGIGYNDKGAAKNIAFDGTPKWNEVYVNLNEYSKLKSELQENLSLEIMTEKLERSKTDYPIKIETFDTIFGIMSETSEIRKVRLPY